MLYVSEASRKLGVNPQTLYFYERIGLIPVPQRNESGYRLYTDAEIERLAFIGRAKSLGLSLDEIREFLALKDGHSLTCKAVHDRLLKKLEQIQQTIQQLQILQSELQPLVDRCQTQLVSSSASRECTVLDG